MAKGENVVKKLDKIFSGWKFRYINARERYDDLIAGWKSRALYCTNCWYFSLGLGT